MTMTVEQAAAMRNAFDVIEEAYEFMLAYAAQGRKNETVEGGEGGESQIRQYLKRFSAALETLETAANPGLGGPEGAIYSERFLADLSVMRSVLGLLLVQPSISSNMVDNTNGLIAVRSFLTNVFFVDQVALPPR
jgi:hypothetical protein